MTLETFFLLFHEVYCCICKTNFSQLDLVVLHINSSITIVYAVKLFTPCLKEDGGRGRFYVKEEEKDL